MCLIAGVISHDVLLFLPFCPLRLVFNRTQHHVTAEVFSSSSPVPVLSCSTKEWALKRELASTTCVAACQAVGEVLAHRCMQAGINRMVYREIPWAYRSDAVSTEALLMAIYSFIVPIFLNHHIVCLYFYSFAGSVIQGSHERGRNHPQRTKEEVCWDMIFNPVLILYTSSGAPVYYHNGK